MILEAFQQLKKSKCGRSDSWNETLTLAYSKINNISKSALYRWIKIYSDQSNLKIKQKVKKESAFLPVVVTPVKKSQDTHELKLNRELPNSRWVSEIITNVIRGLI